MHNDLWNFINTTTKLPRNSRNFPGTMPLSLCRKDLKRLTGVHKQFFSEYVGSFKADGVRQLIGFCEIPNHGRTAFMLDRSETFSILNLSFPKQCYAGTLLDVEFISSHQTCLIFDIYALCGHQVFNHFYPHRLLYAQRLLQLVADQIPNNVEVKAQPKYPGSVLPAGLQVKFPISGVEFLVKTIFHAAHAKGLPAIKWPYPQDGFVWTIVNKTPIFNNVRTTNVFKYKPLDKIALDFLIVAASPEVEALQHASVHKFLRVKSMYYQRPPEKDKDIWYILTIYRSKRLRFGAIPQDPEKPLTAGRIYECLWCEKNQVWVPQHERPDRTKPNNLVTISRTIGNMEENVLWDEIFTQGVRKQKRKRETLGMTKHNKKRA